MRAALRKFLIWLGLGLIVYLILVVALVPFHLIPKPLQEVGYAAFLLGEGLFFVLWVIFKVTDPGIPPCQASTESQSRPYWLLPGNTIPPPPNAPTLPPSVTNSIKGPWG